MDVSVTTPSDKVDPIAKNDGSDSISTNQSKEQQPTDAISPILGTSLSKTLASDTVKHDTGDVEVLVNDTDVDVTATSANNEPVKEKASDINEVDPSPSPKGIEDPNHESTSTDQITKAVDLDSNENMDLEKTESVADDVAPSTSDTILKDSDTKAEPIVNRKSQEDHKTDISPKKVQEQLEEVKLIMERNLFIIT